MSKGADGTDWYMSKGPDGRNLPVDSTPGKDGGDVTLVNPASNIGQPAKSTAVEVGSEGGDGKRGEVFSAGGIGGSMTYYTPGKDGGRAGNVSLTQTGAIVGSANLSSNTALLSIYSLGGDGIVGRDGPEGPPAHGKGGQAGSVTLNLQATVTTTGDHFAGVWAKSIGGQTGNNVYNPRWATGVYPENVSKYPGANAGNIDVKIAKEAGVFTKGSYAPAVIVESIGGAGVDGGTYRNVLPGSGQAGDITFTNSGTIVTAGVTSTGVLLQSVGGRGGQQVTQAPSGDYTGMSGGGGGGKAGNGGTVTAVQAGSITTSQEYSFGLVAMSMGGVGGNGAPAFGGRSGGDGGAAGSGGRVDVVQSGSIITRGKGSVGLMAQSLGGGGAVNAFQKTDITPASVRGGGAGGGSSSAFFPAGRGGTGGAGGNGGYVSVTNDGSILTEGSSAIGMLAQSVGGGGGSGGGSRTVLSIILGTAAGGGGGGGGDGGKVEVIPSSESVLGGSVLPSITTKGNSSSAILAQSVGGGGGIGGEAQAVSAGLYVSVAYAIGGAGGKGGAGGAVSVNNTSILTTSGKEAHGIEARSVGGGGGRAGSASATAIAAAPPGSPSFSITYALGGTGGDGGFGGEVTVVNASAVMTKGEKAYGILATSIGGGGGSGGGASAVSDVAGFYGNLAVSVGVGGGGGGGGNGGAITVNNLKSIETKGAFSAGIQAVSIGGGGGDGGAGSATTKKGVPTDDPQLSLWSEALPVANTLSINVAVGGSGGDGGNGAGVEVLNWSSITTSLNESKGIIAQSIGGGGGNAGGYLSNGAGEYAVRVSLGGSGGKGGAGGKVIVSNGANATITTKGDGSAAIFAQSIGGGGGAGGSMSGAKKSGSVPGGAQAVTNSVLQLADEIIKVNKRLTQQFVDPKTKVAEAAFLDKNSTTQQRLAAAKTILGDVKIFWGSVKDDIKKNEQIRKDNLERAKNKLDQIPEIPISSVLVNALLETTKQGVLNYIKDQFTDTLKSAISSVVGKTPKAGPGQTSINVSIGGSGGDGGAGGDLEITNAGKLFTEGNISYGVFAQSIGGGGGAGGGGATSGSNSYNIGVSIGGTGAKGGAGGIAMVTNSDTIETGGGGSFGIIAQSIGGGGGVGGGAANTDAVASVSAIVNLGGRTEALSKGGDAIVKNSGKIITAGQEAHAIVAQSVGGGGGAYFLDRKSPVSADLLVTSQAELDALNAANDVLKDLGLGAIGDDASAGRDGNSILPPLTASVNIGGGARSGSEGEGKNEGNGGAVSVVHSGTIQTTGLGAMGIFAQSIGGGGGFGAHALPASEIIRNTVLGGSSGTKGDGGTVKVEFAKGAKITTSGAGASGVFAQSIGGGGGYAGAGKGSVTIKGPTEWSRYIPPQPIIGPNGFPLPSIGFFRTGKHGATGNGGLIDIHMQDRNAKLAITTTGERAHGIFAQSLGGGGGAWFNVDGGNMPSVNQSAGRDALMKGVGGVIKINTRGDISATGKDSYAIFAQTGVQKSDGSLDPTRIAYDLSGQVNAIRIEHEGKLWGGSGSGAAIRIDGGYYNRVQIAPGSEVGAESGKAIIASFGNDRVFNDGTVIGDVDLGGVLDAYNDFSNFGTYKSLEGQGVVAVGPRGLFENFGTLDIGGNGTFGKLSVSAAEFRQNDRGSMRVDVTSTSATGQPKSDLLSITGAGGSNSGGILGLGADPNVNVNLAGKIKVHVVGGLRPEEFKVITTRGSMSGSIGVFGANDAAPFTWQTRRSQSLDPVSKDGMVVMWQPFQDLYVKPQANFVPIAGLQANASEQSVMAYLQRAWNAGANSINDQMANTFGDFARVTSAAEYMQSIDSLVPEESSSTLTSQTLNARMSMNASLSCPIFEGSSTLMEESNCAWARIIGTWTDQTSSAEASGYNQSAVTYRVGIQREVIDDWFVGATAGFTQSWLNGSDGFSSTEGNGADAALSLKHQIGPWLFALSGHLGFGSYQTDRVIDIGDDVDQATGTSNVLTGGGRFRASYEFAFSTWYVKPYADFDVLYTYMPAYQEQGIGTTLDFASAQQWNFAFSPNVEIGGRFDLSPSLWLRPHGSVGMTFFAKDSMPIGVSLSDADDAIGDFMTEVTMPSTLVNLAAGVQLFDTKGYEVRAEYKADIGDNYLSQELSARFAVQF
ncbi:hypothetical protein ABLE91_01130 [Aquabacter sp. CN5-332]